MKNMILMFFFIALPAYAQNSPTMTEGRLCTACEENANSSKSITALKTLLAHLLANDQTTCEPQGIGTDRNINIEQFNSSTSVEQKYNIKRTKEKEFEITLNLSFSDERHTHSKAASFAEVWRGKVQKCLVEANNLMIGPNGEKMKFLVYKGQKDRQEPPLVRIKIGDIERSHSRQWEKDIDCSTITHELLHLVGLVDEYAEESIGYVYDPKVKQWNMVRKNPEKTAFDCRKLYDENSIMAYHELAFSDASSTWELKRGICQCNRSDGCKAYIKEVEQMRQKILGEMAQGQRNENQKNTYPGSCPTGFIESGKGWSVGLSDEVKQKYDQGLIFHEIRPSRFDSLDINTPTTFKFEKKSPKSLLEPRHFNAIIYPGCTRRNAQYFRDSANAYLTSKDHGGDGCKN